MTVKSRTTQATSAAPVIVLLGAGRGGTTLLYKLLSLHRDVGYLSNYLARLPNFPMTARLHRLVRASHELKIKNWFGGDGSAYLGGVGRSGLQALVPVPSEAETVYRNCGIPLVPDLTLPPELVACARLGRTFESIRRHAGAKVLVTKRTANDRRIPWLEAAFPGCRYLHLLRDGRAVASSLLKVGWWSDHVLFWTGRTPRQMVAEGSNEIELAARNWIDEMRQIESGLRLVAPERVMQLKYEDLLADPMPLLGKIFDFMGTPVGDDSDLIRSISSLGLKPGPRSWGLDLSTEQRALVQDIQAAELSRWGYASR